MKVCFGSWKDERIDVLNCPFVCGSTMEMYMNSTKLPHSAAKAWNCDNGATTIW